MKPLFTILIGVTLLAAAIGMVSWSTAFVIFAILIILVGLLKWAERSGMCKCC